ncbi:MAG: thiamine pyrophosphate-binding protein [Rhizobiaceae bacterium]
MSSAKTFEVMAEAFVAEGVKTHFALMGTATMHWVTAMATKYGVNTVHARHEHCAVAMADGYHRATGEVGVASVTSGPGFTQISTALTIAVRGSTPLVVFAGDAPTNTGYHIHEFDPGPLAVATGARFINVRHIDRVLDNVREAFWAAQYERRPVVLNVPLDLQKQAYPHVPAYQPSREVLPTLQRPAPDPELVERAVEMLASAERPIVIAGRGAARSGAKKAIEELAETAGAFVATSLMAKGLFDDNPASLGTAGAFAGDTAREIFAESDVVIGLGAALGHYTTEAGYLYPGAQVIHVDTQPRGLYQGLRIADLLIRADAAATAEAITAGLRKRGAKPSGQRTKDLLDRLEADFRLPDAKEFPARPNVVDPRKTMLEIDAAVPKDWDIIVGSGHFFSIALSHMRNRPADRIHVINDFGAIGSALSSAIGIAAARGNGKVLLVEGDGSLMMHVQELETVTRSGIKLAVCVLNDGCYAAEAHKFRSEGRDPSQAVHGRFDYEGLGKAFGFDATTVTQLGGFGDLVSRYEASDRPALWNVHIDEEVPSKLFRRVWFGEQ